MHDQRIRRLGTRVFLAMASATARGRYATVHRVNGPSKKPGTAAILGVNDSRASVRVQTHGSWGVSVGPPPITAERSSAAANKAGYARPHTQQSGSSRSTDMVPGDLWRRPPAPGLEAWHALPGWGTSTAGLPNTREFDAPLTGHRPLLFEDTLPLNFLPTASRPRFSSGATPDPAGVVPAAVESTESSRWRLPAESVGESTASAIRTPVPMSPELSSGSRQSTASSQKTPRGAPETRPVSLADTPSDRTACGTNSYLENQAQTRRRPPTSHHRYRARSRSTSSTTAASTTRCSKTTSR